VRLLYITKFVFVCCMLLMAVSCTMMNTKLGGMVNLDTDFYLDFDVGAYLNPDENNDSSPLSIKLYELNSPTTFEQADFLALYEKDSEVLGGDMVKKQRLESIKPSEKGREGSFVLTKETKYVGLFAEFIRYKNAKYKLVIPVAQNNVISSSAKIQLSGNKMILIE